MRQSCCPIRPAACFCAGPQAWGRLRSSPAATSRTASRRRTPCARCRASTTALRRGCLIRTGSPPPTRTAGSRNPFPFNAYYEEEDAPEVDAADYRLNVRGLVENTRPWTLDELHALPQESQVTRHICIEGWSAIGKWTGTPLREFLRRIGADLSARYVHFACSEGYSSSIDMPTALHAQTQMTFKFDGHVLPINFGFPLRIRIPTKLGFKNPKHVIGIAVLNNYTGGYWEDQGYNWFSGF